jgi:type III pantothenate kinase
MLLAIDIGNTETKIGCFRGGADEPSRTWRLGTDARRTADELAATLAQLFSTDGIGLRGVEGVAVASVVPKLDAAVRAACERLFEASPAFLRPEAQRVMPVRTERPAEVGADLVAAAIGVRARHGAPAIVISYGTATVFTAIDVDGAYVGAAIAPGIGISLDALVARTAKLPQIALEAPPRAIARETVGALQSGVIFGVVGQAHALVARFREELGVRAPVIATGGYAEIAARHADCIDAVDPHASLRGLSVFYHDEIGANDTKRL